MRVQPTASAPAYRAHIVNPREASARSSEWLRLKLLLLLADAAALALALGIAYLLRFRAGIPFLENLEERLDFYSGVAYFTVPAWLAVFALYRLYDRRYLFAGFHEYARVVNACTIGVMVVVLFSFLDVGFIISRAWLLMVWAFSMLAVGSSRFVLRRLVRHLRRRGLLTHAVFIVGANEEGRALAEQLQSDPGSGIRVAGFIDGLRSPGAPVIGATQVLGNLDEVEDLVREYGATDLIVATTAVSRNELLELYRRFAHVAGLEIRLSSGLFEMLTTGAKIEEISYVPLMTVHRVRITGVDAVLKAALDYVGAALGLVVLSPVMLVIALMIKLDSPGPVLHRRTVLGRAGKPFGAFKFRTMVANADRVLLLDPELRASFQSGFKLKQDPRVTRIGRFLRQTSLDELPQLFNVLRGEMSLVGPRMIAPEESALYGKWQVNLLTVRPGITGPWQVRGRSDIPYDERVRLSMDYIRNYNIWSDLEILLRTVPAVLGARGAY